MNNIKGKNGKNKYKQAFVKTIKNLSNNIVMIIFIIFTISFINNVFGTSLYNKIFHHNVFLDSIIGALLGSVSVGNPATSYVLAGEFLKSGISLIAVTSFIVAWVTVGIVQLPYEMESLGRKFAILRNFLSFVFAIFVSIISVLIFNLF